MTQEKAITIKDIAEYFNISVASVSVALNGKSGVSETLRNKIMNYAESVHYVANDSARHLALGSSNKVGIFLYKNDLQGPLLHEPNQDDNPTDMMEYMLINHLIRDFANHGKNVLLYVINGNAETARIQNHIYREKLTGAIIMGLLDDGLGTTAFHSTENCPIVLCDHRADPSLNTVTTNSLQAYELVLNYLIRSHHKKAILFAGPSMIQVFNSRTESLKTLLKDPFYKSIEVLFRECGSTEEDGYLSMCQLLGTRETFDTVICHSDLIAFGVLKGLKRANIRIPEDVSVIGFDDIHAARYVGPSGLTTIRQSPKALSEAICQLIINKEQGQFVEVPVQLIIRSTTQKRSALKIG